MKSLFIIFLLFFFFFFFLFVEFLHSEKKYVHFSMDTREDLKNQYFKETKLKRAQKSNFESFAVTYFTSLLLLIMLPDFCLLIYSLE